MTNLQSESINELVTALSKAQGEMQTAVKDKINPFHKSNYADLTSVWEVARPVLGKNGLCIMQTTEMTPDGSTIILVTTLAHISGQWMKSHLPLKPKTVDSQGIGAAITYSRRYSLSAIIGVVTDEDDDGETADGRGKNYINPTQVQIINSWLVKVPSMKADILKGFKIKAIEHIPADKFDDLIKRFKKLHKDKEIAEIAENLPPPEPIESLEF